VSRKLRDESTEYIQSQLPAVRANAFSANKACWFIGSQSSFRHSNTCGLLNFKQAQTIGILPSAHHFMTSIVEVSFLQN